MACVPPLPPSGHGGSHVFRTCMSYARCAVYTASAIRREQSAIEKREREEEEEENDDRNCKNEVRTGGIRDEVGRHAERLPKERGGGEMPHTSPNATRWDAPVGAHIAFGTLLGRLPTHARNQKKKKRETAAEEVLDYMLLFLDALHKSNTSEMRNRFRVFMARAIDRKLVWKLETLWKEKKECCSFFAGNPCWKGHARRLRVANASTDGASKSPVPKKINQEKRKKKKTPREEGKKNKT